jgi:hypothetical protein
VAAVELDAPRASVEAVVAVGAVPPLFATSTPKAPIRMQITAHHLPDCAGNVQYNGFVKSWW